MSSEIVGAGHTERGEQSWEKGKTEEKAYTRFTVTGAPLSATDLFVCVYNQFFHTDLGVVMRADLGGSSRFFFFFVCLRVRCVIVKRQPTAAYFRVCESGI